MIIVQLVKIIFVNLFYYLANFATIHEFYCTILPKFYIYLQYF